MSRRAVEALRDEMLAQSFPASDPPTWNTAVERISIAETPRTSKGDDMRITVPSWMTLAAVGLGLMVLAWFVPPGNHAIPAVAGSLMLLAALLWSRYWAADIMGARNRPPATPPDARRSKGASE
jgi:hypothetical protein